MDLSGAVLTEHAIGQLQKRQIAEADVRLVVRQPESVQAVRTGRVVAQAMICQYLFRVFVDYRPRASRDRNGLSHEPDCKVPEAAVKATYDPKTDTLTLLFKPGPVAESDEGKPGIILDYDADGNLVGIEVLDASQRVAEARTMEFEVAE
jgi:uncharacterized protein YuzE